MPRNPRRTALIATAVVVVLAIVAVVAYIAGRSGGQVAPTPSPTVTTQSSEPSTASPGYSPTDQSGSPEPGLARGDAAAGEGGSTTGPADLPLGYSHDEAGAVAAATNYLMWLNSIRITDKETADAMVTSAAVDATTRTALTTSLDDIRSGMEGLKADQPEPARGAYAVASYSQDRALVYIWAPEVTTDTGGVSSQLWAIDAVPVVWRDGDWKLDQTLIAKTGAAAVDPLDPTGDPTAAEKHSILARTPADPGGITDSADQTWFEYANAPG